MDRSDTVPDRYDGRHRPDGPTPLSIIGGPILFALGAAIGSPAFLVCGYIIIAFVDQRTPDLPTYIGYWKLTIWLGAAAGVLAGVSEYFGARSAVEDYERGYREWQAEKEDERQKFAQREAQEAERVRRYHLDLERKQALAARRQRIVELETLVLRAQAQHAVDRDFFDTSDPSALLTDFRRQLAKLPLPDLGMLRESEHFAVRQIVGDGSLLPSCPPLAVPVIGPF